MGKETAESFDRAHGQLYRQTYLIVPQGGQVKYALK